MTDETTEIPAPPQTTETEVGRPGPETEISKAPLPPQSARLPQATDSTVVATPAATPIDEIPIHPVLCHPSGQPKFNVGDLHPWNGVYFRVEAVEGMGIVLMAHARLQKRSSKKKGR